MRQGTDGSDHPARRASGARLAALARHRRKALWRQDSPRDGRNNMKHAYVPRTTTYSLSPGDDLNDLRMSDQVRPLYEHVKKFIRETVEPMSVEFYRHGEKKTDRWSFTDDQLAVLQKA